MNSQYQSIFPTEAGGKQPVSKTRRTSCLPRSKRGKIQSSAHGRPFPGSREPARECSLELEEQQKSPTLERPEMTEALRRERYPSVVRMATPVSQPVKRAGQQSTLTEMEIPEVVVLDLEEDTELEAQVARSP